MLNGQIFASRYRIVQSLGTGTQGDVYEALDLHENSTVALKLLGTGGTWHEAQILRQLNDRHILPIRNADQHLGMRYLATDLAAYGSLDKVLSANGLRGLPVPDVLCWIREACTGVARAHDARLLHNDLKPANLFLDSTGACLVADFGMAKALPPGSDTAQPNGFTIMTAAPELCCGFLGQVAVASVRSDVYALGATAYWLLAGTAPYDMTIIAGDPVACAAVVATGPPRPLRDQAPHVPRFVARTIERAMSRHSPDRFESPAEFSSELGRRPSVARIWGTTGEHGHAHVACWRGRRASHRDRVTCVTRTSPNTFDIVTKLDPSGQRVTGGCHVAVRGSELMRRLRVFFDKSD